MSKNNPILEDELFEPGEYLQATGRPGYFSVLAKPNGQAKQNSYKLEVLPQVVRAADPTIDTYITQAVFNGPNRCKVNLRDVGLLFVDLDTYRSAGLADKSPEEQASLLLLFCAQEGLPSPSIVMYSGRGLQAKWLLSEALEPVSLYEWNQAQLALVKLLEPFAADMASRDISRVLRLDRTVNTKSGKICRVVYVTGGCEACPARYDFQELRETFVGEVQVTVSKEEPKKPGKRPVLALPREQNFQRLNWYRLYDLRDLWKIRGGVSEGYRELTLFWELNFLLRADPGKSVWNEAASLAAQIAPGTAFYRNSDLSTLYRKAQEARHGQGVEFAGRTYPPMYTPRNQTLIELFEITPDEEQQMRTIISQAEKDRRRAEKRRAEGARQYEKHSDRPWEALGISRAWWYRKYRTREYTNCLTLVGGDHLKEYKGE